MVQSLNFDFWYMTFDLFTGRGSIGRVPALGAGGSEFESRRPDHTKLWSFFILWNAPLRPLPPVAG